MITNFDDLKTEMKKDARNFEKLRQFILSNKDVLNRPISGCGENMLNVAYRKKASSDNIIEFINWNPIAVRQRDVFGGCVLHSACRFNQSETVIKLLVKHYALAVQEKMIDGWFPLHYACAFNQGHSVIKLLVEHYTEAVKQTNSDGYYPLHLACIGNKSESVIELLKNIHWPWKKKAETEAILWIVL
jgi:ankyrin repeat protein